MGKRLRFDPNLLPLLQGKRVVLVDDAISTGATAVAATRLFERIGTSHVDMVVAMKQTNRWAEALGSLPRALAVRSVFGCPLFNRGADGWYPVAGTQPSVP